MGEAHGSGRTAGMRHPMQACMQHGACPRADPAPSSHVEHDVRAIPGAEHSCEDEDFSESTLVACVRACRPMAQRFCRRFYPSTKSSPT